MKKLIKKGLNRLPYISRLARRTYLLEDDLKVQANEIIGLRESVARLEARNKEWAAEVRSLRDPPKKIKVLWPVFKKDLVKIHETKIKQLAKANIRQVKKAPPYVINWVIPPGSSKDGGIVNIFRFVDYLNHQGHSCNVYIYDPLKTKSNLKQLLESEFPETRAKIDYGVDKMADCDAIFATHWTTAYPVFNFKTRAKKFYFIQDFEPYFSPVGAESTFA